MQILNVMSHKVLRMEAKSLLEVEGAWETLSATSVTLGSNILEFKTEPVNLMNSGQEVSQIVVVSAMACVSTSYHMATRALANLSPEGAKHPQAIK